MQTTSRLDSPRPCWQRRNWRPMRPKPLMATLSFFSAVASTLLALQRVCRARARRWSAPADAMRRRGRATAKAHAESRRTVRIVASLCAARLRVGRARRRAARCYYAAGAARVFDREPVDAHSGAQEPNSAAVRAISALVARCEGRGGRAAQRARRAGETERSPPELAPPRSTHTRGDHTQRLNAFAVAAPWAPRCGGHRRSGPS